MITRKQFVAVRPFSVGGREYAPGDVVSGRDLAHAARLGDTFVASEPAVKRAERADKVEPVDTETPEG